MLNKIIEFISKHLVLRKVSIADNFKEIKNSRLGRITAIDGGCTTLIDGGTWLLSKIRVSHLTYEAKKISEEKEDYYFTVINNEEGYLQDLTPNQELSNKWEGLVKDITEIPKLVMKTLEFRKAVELASKAGKDEVILLDSLIAHETKDQEEALKQLESTAKCFVIGFAKTCRVGINGKSIIGLLLSERPDSRWYYSPVGKDDCSFIVKLHAKSGHAYLINVFSKDKQRVEQALEVLAGYAQDPELLGYPYPLLRVDKVARIGEYEHKQEKSRLRLLSKKKELRFLDLDERATDTHARLDERAYR